MAIFFRRRYVERRCRYRRNFLASPVLGCDKGVIAESGVLVAMKAYLRAHDGFVNWLDGAVECEPTAAEVEKALYGAREMRREPRDDGGPPGLSSLTA